MGNHQYDPLINIEGAKSIRLATVHPGVGDDELVVDLHIEPFTTHSPPRYEALSYVWGSPEPPQFIRVGRHDGATIQITTSLKTALQHLRYPDQKRIMWIDALCINQSDDIEKGAEVARMGELFACAAHVVVWLGPEADESGRAMEKLYYFGSQIDVNWGGVQLITPAAGMDQVDYRTADPNYDLPLDTQDSAAIISLLNRDWFDRLWVRQEILIAEDKGFVCCGHHKMPWPVFRKAVRLLYSKRSEPGNMIHILRPRLSTIGGFIFQRRWTDVLSMRNVFDRALCSDPRDRIFGIKSLLLQDQQELCGPPDYTKPVVDIYLDFTKRYMAKYPNGLTILNQCEMSQSSSWPGPSWVPDWSTKAGYHWGKDTFASSQIGRFYEFPEPRTLRVLGISCTTVTSIQPAPKFYHGDWNKAVEFLRRITSGQNMAATYPSGGSLLRAIARTVVSGAVYDFTHVEGGNYPTSEIAEAELSRFVSGVNLVEEDYEIGSNTQRFLKRMDWGSGGNNFITGTGGYVGLGAPSVQVGDEVLVIVGCQQPLTLRKCPADDKYFVVGECYVEGCARGEPLLGNLPEHVGFKWIDGTFGVGWLRCFIDLQSGELFREDPRLERLGIDLDEFRIRLAEDPEAILSLTPELLLERIVGLRYIDLI